VRRLEELRNRLEAGLLALAPDAAIFGYGAPRLPNTCLFAVPETDATTLLMSLDLAGVAVSRGAACSSGKVAGSPVLAAMGVSPALGAGALRVSLGWNSVLEDVSRFLGAFERALAPLYKRRGQAA